jgi:tetratricopeptide (TPR) repeat protein
MLAASMSRVFAVLRGAAPVLALLGLTAGGLTTGGLAAGCGGAAALRPQTGSAIDAASYSEIRRRYLELAPDAPTREAMRVLLVAHLASRSEATLRAGDYDEIVTLLGEMTSLLAPSDFEPSRPLPAELRPLAEHVATAGARRGDEARVLAAELVLATLDAERADTHRAEYERVSRWGREARSPASPDVISIVEGGVGLIHVWEEHARLTPSPEVLGRLAGLYLGLRDAIRGSTAEEGFRPPRSFGDMEHLEMAAVVMQRAPLEAAAVFLARGDLATAATQVADARDRGGDSWRLRRVLEDAQRDDARGAQALYEIARGFAEARPDVGMGLCRQGLRRFASDARFPLCLARVSSARGSVGDTADYYVQAIDLAPGELDLYDEALDALATMIERGAFSTGDIGEVRTAGRAAHVIIAARAERFADADPGPLDQPTLHLAIARAELGAGNADAARADFEEAIREARVLAETPRAAIDARRELGALELRLGAPDRARAVLGEALELLSQGTSADATRARVLAGVGDAQRVAGHAEDALASYRSALALLDGLETAGAEEEASRQVERGAVLRRLGDQAGSRAAYEQAITLDPRPEIAAEVLQHLVMDTPDPELAELVFRRARVGTPIGHAWKVYLALWVEAVHVLAAQPESEEGARVLAAESAREGWHGRLASLARGALPSGEVLAAAEDRSERCEAHFYAAIRSLRTGDRGAARSELEAAVETGMAGDDEFGMAQELLRALR